MPGNELQRLVGMISYTSGTEHTLKMAEKQLKCYLPPYGWSGFQGVSFIQSIGVTPARVLKLRHEFIEACGIDLSTRLVYSADTFTMLVLDLCEKKKLDFELLFGFSPVDAPKEGNYLVGMVLLLCAGLKLKSKALEGIIKRMRKIIINEKFTSGIIAPTSNTGILDQYFIKSAKKEVKYAEEGRVMAERFPTEEDKFMQTFVDTVAVLQTKRKTLATNKATQKAVRNQLGNKKVKTLSKVLGLEAELSKVQTEMEQASEIEGFEDYDAEMQQEATDPTASNKTLTNNVMEEINRMTVIQLLENLLMVVQDPNYIVYLNKELEVLRKKEEAARQEQRREAERMLRRFA